MPSVELLLATLALDAVLGDPAWAYARVPHPVALIGRLIARLEAWLNVPWASDRRRFASGLCVTALVVGIAAAAGAAIHAMLAVQTAGWLLEALLASTLLAGRSLYEHIHAVALALDQSTAAARAAVAHIVGRDPRSLDDAGIARAAIESAAENLSDGVTAPLFYFALFGLPGLAAYKAINTLDSMLGYRNTRYVWFGKSAAGLDDLANWLPARLTGALLCAAAALQPGASAGGAWATMWRDARRHRSPNAGWPEAAVAGALDFALAGPRRYAERLVDDVWMGSGRAALGAVDVHRTLDLYVNAWLLLGGCATALAAAL